MTYIAHKLKDKEWDYDINLVTWSAGLFYGYVTIVPLCLYVILKYFSVPAGLVQLFCLYGYSLFVFIPALVSCYSSIFSPFYFKESKFDIFMELYSQKSKPFVWCSVCPLCHWRYSDGWLQVWQGSCQQHLWHLTSGHISSQQVRDGS